MIKKNIGTRAQVMHGNAKMTAGGLIKKHLKYNKRGKIVSIKASKAANKSKNLIKAGYLTRKGTFGVYKIGGSNIKNNNPIKEIFNIIISAQKSIKKTYTKPELSHISTNISNNNIILLAQGKSGKAFLFFNNNGIKRILKEMKNKGNNVVTSISNGKNFYLRLSNSYTQILINYILMHASSGLSKLTSNSITKSYDWSVNEDVGKQILEFAGSLTLQDYFNLWNEYINNDDDIYDDLNTIKNTLLRDILHILLELQEKLNFCHGDLKPANIFINKRNDHNIEMLNKEEKKKYFIDEYNIKFGDFDKSRLIWENEGIKYHVTNSSIPYKYLKFIFNKQTYSNKQRLSRIPLKSVLITRHKNGEESICSYFDISCVILYFIINSVYHYDFFLNINWEQITQQFFLKNNMNKYTQPEFKKLIDILIQKTNKNKKSINLVFNFLSINNIHISNDINIIKTLIEILDDVTNNLNLNSYPNSNYMVI